MRLEPLSVNLSTYTGKETWVILLKQATCWAGSLKPDFFKYAVLKFEFANTVVMYCYLSKKGIMSLPDSFIRFIIIIFFQPFSLSFPLADCDMLTKHLNNILIQPHILTKSVLHS